jgi:hypothetical protein
LAKLRDDVVVRRLKRRPRWTRSWAKRSGRNCGGGQRAWAGGGPAGKPRRPTGRAAGDGKLTARIRADKLEHNLNSFAAGEAMDAENLRCVTGKGEA